MPSSIVLTASSSLFLLGLLLRAVLTRFMAYRKAGYVLTYTPLVSVRSLLLPLHGLRAASGTLSSEYFIIIHFPPFLDLAVPSLL